MMRNEIILHMIKIFMPSFGHWIIGIIKYIQGQHEALKYIQGQHKLQPRHTKWVKFLNIFTFTIKHKSGKLNKGVDTLSRKYA